MGKRRKASRERDAVGGGWQRGRWGVGRPAVLYLAPA